MNPSSTLLIAKLVLVAASIWGASLLARRYGHAVSGALAGLPVIVGPIMAMLLVDLPAERVRGIALATLVCEPAMLAHIVVFANAARRFSWPLCLALATLVFVGVAAALAHLDWGAAAASALALVALAVAARALPTSGATADAPVPTTATRLPVRSKSWFQRAEWKTSPGKSARPGSSGTRGSCHGPVPAMRIRAV